MKGPREDTTIEALRALKPAFKKDGTVTAGNAPGVNDGAAALGGDQRGAREGVGRERRWCASWRRRPAESSRSG